MNLDRREFVRLTSSLAIAHALSPPARAAPPDFALSLGYSLYGMKMLGLPESLARCARIGYRNVELCLFPDYPAAPKSFSSSARAAVRSQLYQLGLTVSSLMVSVRIVGDNAEQKRNRTLIAAAARMAGEVQPGRLPPIQIQLTDGSSGQWDELRDRTAAWLRELTAIAAEGGTSIVLGLHANALVNRPERLLWLYHQVNSPALALYYNHIHSVLEGVPLEESWRMLGPFSRFIHLQDVTGNSRKRNYLLPGDGNTDFATYFRMIRVTGYRGPVVVMVSGRFSKQPGYQPVAVAEKCHAAMARALLHSESS